MDFSLNQNFTRKTRNQDGNLGIILLFGEAAIIFSQTYMVCAKTIKKSPLELYNPILFEIGAHSGANQGKKCTLLVTSMGCGGVLLCPEMAQMLKNGQKC